MLRKLALATAIAFGVVVVMLTVTLETAMPALVRTIWRLLHSLKSTRPFPFPPLIKFVNTVNDEP